ncbi:MAG TPA: hypothetical protein VHA30_01600 [Patescibacteria group bacterium]|nr:hypothetical protein [Patescibacteria group bacterium]
MKRQKKQTPVLYIDAADYGRVTFVLDGGKVLRQSYRIDPRHSHALLSRLEAFFKKAKLNAASAPDCLGRIVINKGPGSYTGVRASLALALALGLAWGVPVKAVAKNAFVVM